ncbi:MAG: hypothetical protein KDG89_01295 [Geminicoccaceae bacterium]|nr:hypothetical protein [Geminicoccaceae bacterium]
MRVSRLALALVFLLVMGAGLSGCGDTWRGVKQDTSDNTAATGKAIENAGEKVQDAAQ